MMDGSTGSLPFSAGEAAESSTPESPSGSVPGVTSQAKTPASSCAPTAIERLQMRIKDVRQELEGIYNSDVCEDEALKTADQIARRIASYETHLNALSDKAVLSSRPVNLRDIPRFQITGQCKHYDDYPSYSSLEHFLSSFETVELHASGNDVEQVWKQYIPVAMYFMYKTWVQNDLLMCSSWNDAKAVVCKAYVHQHVPEDYMHIWLYTHKHMDTQRVPG
ncbi:hypothetical protein MUCCIDRAFT_85793 [Mucor lusitanicus CBS 277.49]|uniref:Uncharacterized protein n=2 Tax=Mucor circinelloides f. lusitanicus TaxID=29924 RepID=A0A168IUZ6_MUCCL|nr:hypothetical protein MUCCIDRAFT_85793 [Mucor lusitanicus CBS 277.49]